MTYYFESYETNFANGYSVEWTFGDGNTSYNVDNATHQYSSTGTYDVTQYVYDSSNSNCWDEVTYSITIAGGTAPWNYNTTAVNHSILVPQTALITVDGNAIVDGDYVGVFYDSLGTLVCGGYTLYQTNSGNMFITAWGADVGNDGFATGEEFTWKIWQASNQQEYSAEATYDQVNFTNDAYFAANGMSGILSLAASTQQTQQIILYQGWNIMSTYIDPILPGCPDIFSAYTNDVIIVKNYTGMVYWPQWGINAIGNLVIGEGYQVKMSVTHTFDVVGYAIVPENTPIELPLGWKIIAYLRQSPASIVQMFSAVVSDLEIAKDETGMVYWPQWGINAIGNMLAGEGYYIKMTQTQWLTYPANTANLSKVYNSYTAPKRLIPGINTGNNMSLGIPVSAWDILPDIGDE
ncbi:MAG: PKD domain-containing protein, partial [Bacteroidota bacterium]|nr:PKD domain-containing protein [Bacteroidota bacterium]